MITAVYTLVRVYADVTHFEILNPVLGGLEGSLQSPLPFVKPSLQHLQILPFYVFFRDSTFSYTFLQSFCL
jgi:hypothetical protein